ncbi:MAG: hypothetical protein AAF843_03755 [Bacteroidota bacterium]
MKDRLLIKTLLIVNTTIISLNTNAQQEINNLILPEDYPTIPFETPLKVDKIGKGKSHIIIIPGLGHGVETYQEFAESLSKNFTSHLINVPGYGNTASYPLPGGSYGNQIWTDTVKYKIAEYAVANNLNELIVIGNHQVSTQMAVRLGIDYPDLVKAVIIAGGPTALNVANMPQVTPALRASQQDLQYAPNWFKTVSPETWKNGSLLPSYYSKDAEVAQEIWNRVTNNNIPVMIQYVEEYFSQDTEFDFNHITVPTHVFIPGFSNIPANVPLTATAAAYDLMLKDPWVRGAEKNEMIKTIAAPESHTMVVLDSPDLVKEKLLEIIGK